MNTIRLGVNIDHVATIRQARYRENPFAFNAEPSPVVAAQAAERGGAEGITVHLRADRRHIQDRDLFDLAEVVQTKINLELGNTPEIVDIALRLQPSDVCLVPESREEVTTEGGLDCLAGADTLRPTIENFQGRNIWVSLFVDPDPRQIEAAAALGARYVELHTGAYANAQGDAAQEELRRLFASAQLAHDLGLKVNAGHGLNYQNLAPILAMPHLEELNIGHSIISRSVVVGLEAAVREMVGLIRQG